jgi:cytochrome c oxidase cbb3-type subunit 4
MNFINYIEKVTGVDVFGLISLMIFVLFFAVILTWVFRADKKKMKAISEIPLQENKNLTI